MENKRVAWIDFAKTIGIFLVVVGHYRFENVHVAGYIFMFHMPLFFFIAGLLTSPIKIKASPVSFIKDRVIRLIVPYYLFQLIGCIWLIVRYLMIHKSLDGLDYLGMISGSILGDPSKMFIVPAWFLLSLFCCSMLLYACTNYKSARLFIVIGILLSIALVDLPRQFSLFTVPYAFVYYFAGFALNSVITKISIAIEARHYATFIISLILMVIVGVTYSVIGSMDMGKGYYTEFPAISLLVGFMGICGIAGICISLCAEANLSTHTSLRKLFVKVIQAVSSSTLLIMCAHVPIMEFVNLNVVNIFSNTGVGVISAVAIIIVLTLSMPVCVRYFPALVGIRSTGSKKQSVGTAC